MRIPTSTYRLQITADFDLFAAAGRLAYLHDLGVDWVYLSPLLAAEPGSTHGYDVVAHDHLDAERGGAEGLAAVSAEARRLGMGVLVDIVPNHVGVATPHEDPWWWDVLRHGRTSEHAHAFDVDWAVGDGRIRIPVVGDDDLLPDGRIGHLALVDGELRYHDHRFPIAPGTLRDASSLGSSGQAAEVEDDPDVVHDRQHYELVDWHVADDGLNYRRFFAVSTLAAIRVEDPEVFTDSHVEIARWFSEGLVDGLRVDHPDGLRDPAGYLRDLADLTGGAYVLVEKILEPGEELPTSWATAGTTGYDALGQIDRVLTDPAGREPLDALETRLRGHATDWPQLIHDTKRAVADTILHSEVNRITRELLPLLGGPPLVEERAPASVSKPPPSVGAPGFETGATRLPQPATSKPPSATAVADAVAELLACFPVYRSYLPEGRAHLDEAFTLARRHRPDLAATYDALAPVLADPGADPALRFQQTSGMVMAKGVEDCAFYRYARLTSLNEVGGDPSEFAIDADAFHAFNAQRQATWPAAMTCLSTHDTKRGEDVRARITVLAEVPDLWAGALDRLLSAAPLPDPGFGNLLWQAVLGAWPARPHPDLRDRLHGYAEKAMREAGDRTTWTEPDAAYEQAVHAAVDAAIDDPAVTAVLEEVLATVTGPGWSNALAAKLLALTMPGVPDVYQGSELWEQSLVDPDNRRPVDFDVRAALLPQPAGTLTASLDDPGTAKLAVTRAALRLRRDRPELFTGYTPVGAHGPAAGHVLAFDRGGAIAVATRLPVGLAARGGWGDTVLYLPPGSYVDAVGGRTFAGDVPLAELLADLPVALLAREA